MGHPGRHIGSCLFDDTCTWLICYAWILLCDVVAGVTDDEETEHSVYERALYLIVSE